MNNIHHVLDLLNQNQTKYMMFKEYVIWIEKELKNDKILLLSYHEGILNYIIENKIPYCLVYPAKDLSFEYAKRMIDRGNNYNFVHQMTDIDKWDFFYEKDINDKNAKQAESASV